MKVIKFNLIPSANNKEVDQDFVVNNYFKGKNILKISTGDKLVSFLDDNSIAHITAINSLNNKGKFIILKNVKTVCCEGG